MESHLSENNVNLEVKSTELKKVIRDNKLAVLYSKGFGAGWYTWNREYPQCLYHPTLVEMVEQNRQLEINEEFMLKLLDLSPEKNHFYCSGADDLAVAWLELGTKFYVHEYDGSEEIWTPADFIMTATA